MLRIPHRYSLDGPAESWTRHHARLDHVGGGRHRRTDFCQDCGLTTRHAAFAQLHTAICTGCVLSSSRR